MIYEYFGPADRQLFGALSATKRLTPRGAAVMLCNPFGEEAVRAHRSYRVLAQQLTRLGYSVLRFDFSCTGDSMGEGEDATLDRWLDDIEVAESELRAKTNRRAVVVVGLRFGGTLAALASARRGLKLRHLVLWDPVVDGREYLRALDAAHDEYMRAELRASSSRAQRAFVNGGTNYPTELLGTPLSSELAAAIANVDLAREDIRAEQTTVIATGADPKLEILRESLAKNKSASWLALSSRTPWNSDSALNSQLVPMDILERMIQRIEEISP